MCGQAELSKNKAEYCPTAGSWEHSILPLCKCSPRAWVHPLGEARASGTAPRTHFLLLLHGTVVTLTLLGSFYPCGDKDCLEATSYVLTSDPTPNCLCFILTPTQAKLWVCRPMGGPASSPARLRSGRGNWAELVEVCRTSPCRVAFAKEKKQVDFKSITMPLTKLTEWEERTKKQIQGKFHLIWKLLIFETIKTDPLNTICIESLLRAKPHFKRTSSRKSTAELKQNYYHD